jgi:hypothetical protein
LDLAPPGIRISFTDGMFVNRQADLPIAVADAQARLADLTHAGWLLSASQDAYEAGASLARSGAPGSAWCMCGLVAVHTRNQAAHHNLARLALRWEAATPGGERFPALDADITLTPAGDRTTTLALTGVYRPPPRQQGVADDRATVERVVAATIGVFLDRIAAAICRPVTGGKSPRPAAP